MRSVLKNDRVILFIVGIMITTYLFASSVCVPALPTMQLAFNTSIQFTQAIIILYTFGLGISQFFYGPCSDYFGRRKTLFFGTSILLLGSLIVVIADNIALLLCGRLLQGLGAGCYSVVGKSITNDIYKNEKYINATVIMMLFSVLAQIISPIIGGYLTSWYSWHANLIAIVIYVIVTLVIILFFLPETAVIKNSSQSLFKNILLNYSLVSRVYYFWLLLIISAATLGAITIYQIISPFILQNQLGLSPVSFGWATMLTASGFLMGNLSISILNKRFILQKRIYIGLIIMTLGAGCMLTVVSLLTVKPLDIIISMFVFNIGTGIVFPLTTAGALLHNQKYAGSAGAIIGGFQMLLIAAMSYFISNLKLHSPFSLAFVLFLISILGLFSLTTYQPTSGTIYETS